MYRATLRTSAILLAVGASLSGYPAAAQVPEVNVPPPVSGRNANDSKLIDASDVLARVKLVRAHLEDVRVYMGVPPPPAPLIRVDKAQAREAFVQAANAYRRVQQLGFELLRVPQERLEQLEQAPEAANILFIVNGTLFRILQIKRA
ncbi:MAG: hypothetical protein AAFV29_01440, partial [Myxococcota bacterium]